MKFPQSQSQSKSRSQFMKHTRVIFLAVALVAGYALPLAAQGNILIIVADDFGVDKLCRYRVDCADVVPEDRPNAVPTTPVLDSMMDEGLTFANAWANPVCSTTRATIQTGQYSRRNGILAALGATGFGIAPEDPTIPKMLAALADAGILPERYETAAFGKWHLNGEIRDGEDAPVEIAGYDYFEGTMANLGREEPVFGQEAENYCGFKWYTFPGELGPDNPEEIITYATSHTVDRAIDWIADSDREQPWLVYLALHAPHDPFQEAIPGPEVQWPTDPTIFEPEYTCGAILDPRAEISEREAIVAAHKTMIEAMDREIGVLIDKLTYYEEEEGIAFPTILFVGDNGTDMEVIDRDFYPLVDGKPHAKTSVFQGGVHVPLIAFGTGVAGPHVVDRVVQTTDLFYTVAELAGANPDTLAAPVPIDSFSLVPYFDGNPPNCNEETCRPGVYAEIFSRGTVEDDGTIRPATNALAVRAGQPPLSNYKLVRGCLNCMNPQSEPEDEACDVTDCADGDCLYNLATDPAELIKLDDGDEESCPDFDTCGKAREDLDALLESVLMNFVANDPTLSIFEGCIVRDIGM